MDQTGFLEKRGKWNTQWKKRYFYFDLIKRELVYSKAPGKSPKGSIELDSRTQPLEGVDDKLAFLNAKDKKRSFSVVTRDRVFQLRAVNEVQAAAWRTAILDVIEGHDT